MTKIKNLKPKKNKHQLSIFNNNTIIFLIVFLALTGCAAVGPDYVPPEVNVPNQWNNTDVEAQKNDPKLLAQWWQVLNDPVLTSLIDRAAADNLDLKVAISRLKEARLQRLKSRSSLFPTLDASGGIRKSYIKDEDSSGNESDLYTAGFDAGWELDIFGGVRRSIEAAQADIEAEIENFHDVMVTLMAEVAINYIDLRTYQSRLKVAKSNIASQYETWELLNALVQAGRGDEVALAQATYNLESSRAKIPDLHVGIESVINRLAVLTGQFPGSLHKELSSVSPLPNVTIDLSVGVPADIIRQRPDIRKAERELAAQTARIGEAEADLYPKFNLSGSIGIEAISLDNLFSSPGRSWSLGSALGLPIFNAGSIRNNIAIQIELQKQALINYESSILSALEEVQNSLISYVKDQEKLKSLNAAAKSAALAAELSEQQYTTGMTGFSDVLDAQRSLLSFENELTEVKGAILSDLVTLYKALGGGWNSFDKIDKIADKNNKS